MNLPHPCCWPPNTPLTPHAYVSMSFLLDPHQHWVLPTKKKAADSRIGGYMASIFSFVREPFTWFL